MSFTSYFKDPNHLHEVSELLTLGVSPKSVKQVQIQDHQFKDKTFVLTGSLNLYSRSQATDLIKERGGKVTGSVTKKTNFVLVGEEPGSKYDKALSLGIQTLSEEQFNQML